MHRYEIVESDDHPLSTELWIGEAATVKAARVKLTRMIARMYTNYACLASKARTLDNAPKGDYYGRFGAYEIVKNNPYCFSVACLTDSIAYYRHMWIRRINYETSETAKAEKA